MNGSVGRRESRAWVEVNLAAVVENARTVARVAGSRLLPVVKANGYGVGAVAVSKALEALDPWGSGVATVDEGAELRAAGITRPVLVFMPARPDVFDAYHEHRLTPALGDHVGIHAWMAREGRGGAFHLEIDTGMGRSGVRWDEIESLAGLLDTPNLEGCYTHFHSADRRDGSADAQLERFKQAVTRLARRPPLLHAANSAAALRGKPFALDMIRPGIYLYGASPGEGLPGGKPAIALRARVVSVRTVRQGESVARCPVVGRVTMDLTMVDVRDGRAAMGDVATVIGEVDGQANTLDQFAVWSGTLPHELLVGLGPRLPRLYR